MRDADREAGGGDGVEARVRASFDRQALMETLGARLGRVAPGEVEIELPADPRLSQQDGFMHAGALATVADSACGYACLTLMPEGTSVLSVEFKINLMAPAVGDSIVARASCLRAGRTISVATAEVFARAGDSEKLVAAMQATMMRIEGARP